MLCSAKYCFLKHLESNDGEEIERVTESNKSLDSLVTAT